jgi:hypothetical protein
MYPLVRCTVGLGVLATLAGCGQVSQGVSPGPELQQLSFTGFAEPATGRFQVVTGPQAAIGKITEDKDGNPATVTAGTAQIYGSSVAFASGGVGYPAVCNADSPLVMSASVEIFSGFTEQLRYVYARITSKSGGLTFCTVDSAGAFGGSLTPNVGLYGYQPLDGGASSAIRRSVQWAMNLPDNGAFWFSGELWAVIIPQVPTIGLPADNATYRTGDPVADVQFTWSNDPLANGGTDAGLVVPRPTAVGAQLTIRRCGVSTTGYVASTCTVTFLDPTVITTGEYALKVPNGYWYQWSLRAVFTLPGSTTRMVGTLVSTRSFKVAR